MDYEKDEIQEVVISDNSGISVAGVEETAVSAGIIYMPEGYTADNVTYNDDGTVTVVVDSITYTGGKTAANPPKTIKEEKPVLVIGYTDTASDGGVYGYVDVDITNVIFSGNSAIKNGGVVIGSVGTFSNVSFYGNTATLSGGVYGSYSVNVTGDVSKKITFKNSNFVSNKAIEYGGVIAVTKADEGNVDIIGGNFSSNTAAEDGGAIYFKGAKLTIKNGNQQTVFEANNAVNGGAIYIADGGTTTSADISNAIFRGNTVTTNGGAIYYKNTKSAETYFNIDGIELINNTAKNGGAIFIDAETIGAVTIDEAVFGGNTSSDTKGVSGAIYNKASVAITGSTFLTSSDTIYLYAGSNTAASLYFYGKNIINADVTRAGLGTASIIVSDEDIYDEETGELLHSATEFVFHDYSSWDKYENVNSAWTKGDITVAKELAGAKTLQFNGFAGEKLSVKFTNAVADDFKNTDVYFKNIGTVSVSGIIAAGAKSLTFDVSGDSNSMTFSDKQEVAGDVYINVTAGTLTAGAGVTVAGNFLDADVGTAAYQVNGVDVTWKSASIGTATADNANYLVYKDGTNLYLAETTGETEYYTTTDMAIVNGTANGSIYTATVGDTTYISSSSKEKVTISGTVENLIVSGQGILGWSGGNKAASISNVIFANWNGTSGVLALSSGTNTEASLSLTDVEFYGNTNSANGGAVYIYKIPVFNASNTRFLNNNAENGGAVYLNANAASVSFDGALFSGNTADKNGGAIYNAGTLTVSNASFLTDTDTVYNAGTLKLKGNITTAAAFTVDGTRTSSGVTYTGTVTAEKDTKITLDYSADNKAGYISNLAALSGTYSLSALLADDVTNGIYTLAGGASSYADTITVKNSTGNIIDALAVGSTTGKDGIVYSLAVNDENKLVLTVTDKLVLGGTVTADEKGNYTNTTGASVEVDGANITNNLYASVSGSAVLTVTSGEIKNIFAGAKFELGDEETDSTEDITATVGGGDITTTRIYGGNAVLGGTVETVNTTLTISGELIAKDLSTGVWCYGAGIAASQTKDGTTTSGTLKITGTSKVEVTATGSVGSIVGGGRAQGIGSLDVNATSVTISNATVTNAIGGAYNSGSGSVTIGTAEMSISSQNVTTVFGGNFIAPVSDNVFSDDNLITKVNLTLNGAKASNAIFGGNYMKAGEASITNVNITVGENGANAACGIYGGGFIVGAASETIGEVNITVSGTVVGNIFAGACVSGKDGSSTVEKATITISGDVTGNIYAGGYSVKGTAAVKECTITFSGNQSYFSYNGKVCATSAGSVKTDAPNPSTVVFDKYVGDFGGAFAGTFDVIEFTADSSVNFKGSDNIIFDGLKTDAVQITGISDYSADTEEHTIFTLGKNQSYNVNNITLQNANNEQYTLSEVQIDDISTYAYFWDNENKAFGYVGADAINAENKGGYTFYQLANA